MLQKSSWARLLTNSEHKRDRASVHTVALLSHLLTFSAEIKDCLSLTYSTPYIRSAGRYRQLSYTQKRSRPRALGNFWPKRVQCLVFDHRSREEVLTPRTEFCPPLDWVSPRSSCMFNASAKSRTESQQQEIGFDSLGKRALLMLELGDGGSNTSFWTSQIFMSESQGISFPRRGYRK